MLMLCTASFGAVKLDAETRTKHFIIKHEPDMETTARIIGESCEEWLASISKELNATSAPPRPITVMLYPNKTGITDQNDNSNPSSVVGRASSSGYIELDASGELTSPDQIAGHEIAHIVIFNKLGNDVGLLPLWFNEGIAKYMSKSFDDTDKTKLGDALAGDTIIPLSELSNKFPDDKDQALAYAESISAITFFVRTYGEHSLAAVLNETVASGSFDKAMIKVTGISEKQFESMWMKNLEGNFGILIRFSRTIMGLVTIAMPILALAAYLAVRRKKQRLALKYELEEANRREWGEGGW